jgi:hypothetical protein
VKLYFGGAEMGSHRRLLDEFGVKHVALSYMGLRERNQMKKPWLITEQKVPFPSYMSVFLDSGTHKINRNPEIESDEIEEISFRVRSSWLCGTRHGASRTCMRWLPSTS